MKLSKRLSALKSMIGSGYDHIWDVCCDHGYLGFALLARYQQVQSQQHHSALPEVHFVDVVPHLMAQLQTELQAVDFASRYHLHCQDAGSIRCSPEHRHLVIIAGVGGDVAIEIIRSILKNHENAKHIEFLLAPVHHLYRVRQFLRQSGFALLAEQLLVENKRCYELLHVSLVATTELSLVGQFWDLSNLDHQNYLNQCIAHYQKRALGQCEYIEVLQAYMGLRSLSEKR